MGDIAIRSDLLLTKRDRILEICAKHGAINIRVFGSFARGEERPDSDLDLLVEAGEKTSQWWPGGLVLDLEDLLGRHVDVVTPKGLNPLLRESVLSEASPL